MLKGFFPVQSGMRALLPAIFVLTGLSGLRSDPAPVPAPTAAPAASAAPATYPVITPAVTLTAPNLISLRHL